MKWLVFAGLIASGSVAECSEVEGLIRHIRVRASDGLHYVEMKSASTPRPTCASGTIYYMIRDERSDTGKAQLAMLMSAFFANKSVRIYGAGTCARWGDGEDIDTIALVG